MQNHADDKEPATANTEHIGRLHRVNRQCDFFFTYFRLPVPYRGHGFLNIFGCRFLIVGMVLHCKWKNLQCKTMPTIRNRQPQTQNTEHIQRLHWVNRRCDFFFKYFWLPVPYCGHGFALQIKKIAMQNHADDKEPATENIWKKKLNTWFLNQNGMLYKKKRRARRFFEGVGALRGEEAGGEVVLSNYWFWQPIYPKKLGYIRGLLNWSTWKGKN